MLRGASADPVCRAPRRSTIVTALVFAARRPAPAAALAPGASLPTRARGRCARRAASSAPACATASPCRGPATCACWRPAYWAFDAAVLWAMLHAFGAAPSFAVVVLAYFVGQVGNTLPIRAP